jgi:hypothetical protein
MKIKNLSTMIAVVLIATLAGFLGGCEDRAGTRIPITAGLEKVSYELQISIYMNGYKQGRLDQMQQYIHGTENKVREDCLTATINFINLLGMDTTYYAYARENSR